MEDKLIKCEHCGSDMCYATPINETDWSYSCTGCGFTANDILKEGEFDMEQFEEIFPEQPNGNSLNLQEIEKLLE